MSRFDYYDGGRLIRVPLPPSPPEMEREPDPACGTTGCEAHDGECRDNWGTFDAPSGDTFWRMT